MTSPETDPRQYLRMFWRRKLLFLACLILVPAIAYGIASREQTQYQSNALLQENPVKVDTSLFSTTPTPAGSGTASAQELGGEARVIDTSAVAALAARHLTPRPARPSSLLASIKATPSAATGFITITATAAAPKRAAAIANAFAVAVVDLRTQQALTDLNTTIDRVQSQLSAMNAEIARLNKQTGSTNAQQLSTHLSTEATQLSANLQQLRAIRAAQVSDATVLQRAVPEDSPTAPDVPRIVGLGAVVGLLLAIALVLVAETADRRVRQVDELESLTQLPMLSAIPKSASTSGPLRATEHEREAFQMLRSSLMFFSVDDPLSTVLISSPTAGDGKSTVATGLALAAARAGQDVILVDADLRRPRVANLFDLPHERESGMLAVLTGQSRPADELIEIPLGDHHAGGDGDLPARAPGRLRVLPTAHGIPNPAEQIASRRMHQLLLDLRGMSTLVVIDSSPLLTVSDAWPLVESVSGVLVMAQLGATRRPAIRRLMKMFENTNANVLGVVATGASRATIGDYGYGYGYSYRYIDPAGNVIRTRRRRARTPAGAGPRQKTTVVAMAATTNGNGNGHHRDAAADVGRAFGPGDEPDGHGLGAHGPSAAGDPSGSEASPAEGLDAREQTESTDGDD